MTFDPRRNRPRILPCVTMVVMALAWFSPPAVAQDPPPKDQTQEPPSDQFAAKRRDAMRLSAEHRDLEALPLFEELAREKADDRVVQEGLAKGLIIKAATVPSDEAAALLRRARSILLELKKTGKLSNLAQIYVDAIPPDGAPPKFSDRGDVQAAMQAGEAAFARHDFVAARRSYQQVLKLDPRSHEAALFIGDSYFVENKLDEARTWFTRAAIMAPNSSTPHRYLGDALSKAGEDDLARLSYLDGILAEPYNRRPWMSLSQWLSSKRIPASRLEVVPADLEAKGKAPAEAPKPDADDGRSHWHLYAETLDAWAKDRFKAVMPEENAYRHSLAEEVDALRTVAKAVDADIQAGRIKEPHPGFVNLIKLDREGLLEPHILYFRANAGIAQDYAPYREKHRGELRRYLTQYVAVLPEAKPE